MIARGCTFSEVARELGVTRNAVAGRTDRMRRKAGPPPPPPLPVWPPKRDPAKEPRGCRWIDGDPKTKDWGYCQKTTVGDGDYPWCKEHRLRVYMEW